MHGTRRVVTLIRYMGSLHCNVSNAKMHPTQRQEDEFIEKKRMKKCPINAGEKQCSKLYYTVGF